MLAARLAEVMTYAAYLRGTALRDFESSMVGAQIQAKGYESVVAAMAANDLTGSFDPEAFLAGVEESLSAGNFRLVLVLDAAPPELVKLVGYLESVAPQLLFDRMNGEPV